MQIEFKLKTNSELKQNVTKQLFYFYLILYQSTIWSEAVFY